MCVGGYFIICLFCVRGVIHRLGAVQRIESRISSCVRGGITSLFQLLSVRGGNSKACLMDYPHAQKEEEIMT
jgi:hypothetical protein